MTEGRWGDEYPSDVAPASSIGDHKRERGINDHKSDKGVGEHNGDKAAGRRPSKQSDGKADDVGGNSVKRRKGKGAGKGKSKGEDQPGRRRMVVGRMVSDAPSPPISRATSEESIASLTSAPSSAPVSRSNSLRSVSTIDEHNTDGNDNDHGDAGATFATNESYDAPATLAPAQIALKDCGPHPLMYNWCLWYTQRDSGKAGDQKNYAKKLKSIATIKTVEDFWITHMGLPPLEELPRNANYHLFREGIEPKWEDNANKSGGKWTISTKQDRRVLSVSWLHTCLAIIGQTLDETGNNICGVVGSLRKSGGGSGGGNRVAVWMRWTSKKEPNVVKSVGYRLLQMIHGELPDIERGTLQLTYMHHADSMKSGFSYKNQSKLTEEDLIEWADQRGNDDLVVSNPKGGASHRGRKSKGRRRGGVGGGDGR